MIGCLLLGTPIWYNQIFLAKVAQLDQMLASWHAFGAFMTLEMLCSFECQLRRASGHARPGLFAMPDEIAEAYPLLPHPAGEHSDQGTCHQYGQLTKRSLTGWGIFYGGNGNQLGLQVLAIVTILVWSLSINLVVFGALKKLKCLRVSEKVELDGLDHSQAIGSGVVFGCACLT